MSLSAGVPTQPSPSEALRVLTVTAPPLPGQGAPVGVAMTPWPRCRACPAWCSGARHALGARTVGPWGRQPFPTCSVSPATSLPAATGFLL